jgi:glycerol kinase
LAGELAVGTIDSWLIYKLTGGQSHVTDVSNASRTMLMNIRTGAWDPDLLALFNIPEAVLPQIVSSSERLGVTDPSFLGVPIPVCSAIGDQQSALFGQLCTRPGMVKCTYGTGCFLLVFTGPDAISSSNRLLTTVAWRIGNGPLAYALEGSVFMGGASIQWLRDGLGIIHSAPEVNALASRVPDSGGVILVPAFTGLGAPYWDSTARGTLLGMTRGTTAAHIARATLDGIAFQITDLVAAMEKDSSQKITTLRVDGGASASDLLMQTQADTLGITVERPANIESTALGAAMLAGLGCGLWPSIEALSENRAIDRHFESSITVRDRRTKLKTWKRAVKRAQKWEPAL